LRVIEDWTTADYLAALGMSGELRRFRILVSGPMPGRPEESGEFRDASAAVGDRPGWWICPEGAV
jgi:hypothetical protein